MCRAAYFGGACGSSAFNNSFLAGLKNKSFRINGHFQKYSSSNPQVSSSKKGNVYIKMTSVLEGKGCSIIIN